MDQAVFDQYRATRYEPAITWYDAKAQQNQRVHKRMQWILAISAALTPVFIGFDFLIEYPWFKLLPLTTSGIVAATSAAQNSFKFEQNWLNYRATCEALRREIYLYQAGSNEYANHPDREAAFIERVEARMANEMEEWQKVFSSKSGDVKVRAGH